MKILSIESSCDETAAAVIEDGRKIISSVINTQVAEHGLYGGVVPEIASRRHTENIVGVVEKALAEYRQKKNAIKGSSFDADEFFEAALKRGYGGT